MKLNFIKKCIHLSIVLAYLSNQLPVSHSPPATLEGSQITIYEEFLLLGDDDKCGKKINSLSLDILNFY